MNGTVTKATPRYFLCSECGRRVRSSEVSSITNMCQSCYEHAQWEAYHDDMNHAAHPDPECPICRERAALFTEGRFAYAHDSA
jgi:NMD protein affecting ribosome stability and mRNA decay